MEKQVEYFRDYKRRMEVAIGKEATKWVISKAAFLVSAGTNDVVLNYYGTPFRRNTYDIHAYLQFLLHNAQNFIKVITNYIIIYIFIQINKYIYAACRS